MLLVLEAKTLHRRSKTNRKVFTFINAVFRGIDFVQKVCLVAIELEVLLPAENKHLTIVT
jgi:hypothetical protein